MNSPNVWSEANETLIKELQQVIKSFPKEIRNPLGNKKHHNDIDWIEIKKVSREWMCVRTNDADAARIVCVCCPPEKHHIWNRIVDTRQQWTVEKYCSNTWTVFYLGNGRKQVVRMLKWTCWLVNWMHWMNNFEQFRCQNGHFWMRKKTNADIGKYRWV